MTFPDGSLNRGPRAPTHELAVSERGGRGLATAGSCPCTRIARATVAALAHVVATAASTHVVPGISRQQDAHLLALADDRDHRRHRARRGRGDELVGIVEPIAAQVLDRREDDLELAAARSWESSASCGRIHVFARSRGRRAAPPACRGTRHEEPGVVAARRALGRDPVAEVVDAIDGELEVLLGAHLDQPSFLRVDRRAVRRRSATRPPDRRGAPSSPSASYASRMPASSKHSRTAATQNASPPLSIPSRVARLGVGASRCSTDRGPRDGRADRRRRRGTRTRRRRRRS